MEVYRIKHNYRYIIYKIKNDYCLVDLYDHCWLTILFPFLGWFLYHKAYFLDNDDLQKFNMISKRKLSSLSVGGISLLIAPLIVTILKYPLYIYNFNINGKVIHLTIISILSILLIYVYIKSNHIEMNKKVLYVKIFPFQMESYVKGIVAYMLFIFLGYGIFYFPLQSADFLLSMPFMIFSVFTFLYIIYIGYVYMENMGPYDYQFKDRKE